jgi:hypothetical protein
MRRFLALAPLAICLCACPRPLPTLTPPVEPPAPVRIPSGCGHNLTGSYQHASNSTYRYEAEDDGESLSLVIERLGPDGGLVPIQSDGGPSLQLARTPKGFVGLATGTGFTSAGHPCPVTFATELIECNDGGIVLRTAASASINDACQSPQTGPPPVQVIHRLIRRARVQRAPGDGGSAGGGPSDGGA